MYSIILGILSIFLIPYLKIKSLKNGYSFSLKERFVLYGEESKDSHLWFHCASIGELNTLKPVYNYYKNKFKTLITVSSPRAKHYAIKNFKDAKVVELPFDFKFCIKRFINIYNPTALIIVEEELWHNLIIESSKKFPVLLINGRISPKSFEMYKRFGFFYKKVIDSFNLILVRNEEDKQKFLSFTQKVKLCGDLKLCSSLQKRDINLKIPNNKKVIVAGSTYDIEEKWLFEIKKSLKNFVLIVAPRHIERISEIVEFLKGKNIDFQLYSKSNGIIEKDVLIVDKMGVLSSLYKYADVVFVGGTVANIGGHNILEPLAENKPVIIGENYYKINQLVNQFREHITIIKNKEELLEALSAEYKSKNIDIEGLSKRILDCYIKSINHYLQ